MRLFRVENNRRRSNELSTCGVCGATKIRAESRSKRLHSMKACRAFAILVFMHSSCIYAFNCKRECTISCRNNYIKNIKCGRKIEYN